MAINRPDEFRVPAPLSVSDASYKSYVDEVASKGSDVNSTRTDVEQTLLQYWIRVDNLGFWFDAAASLTTSRSLPNKNITVLFSMLAVGQYDAIIAVGDSKKAYFTWRPRTAIRDSQFGNQPSWTPYLASDNSPEYPSTTATIAMMSAKILINYFKVDNGVNVTVAGSSWPQISLAAEDEGYSKVLEGVHFSSSVEAGFEQGEKLADSIYSTHFSQGAATPLYVGSAPSAAPTTQGPLGLSAMGAVGLAVLIIIILAVIFALIFFCTPLRKRFCPPTTVE